MLQINLSDGFYQNILFKSITHYFNKFKNILKLITYLLVNSFKNSFSSDVNVSKLLCLIASSFDLFEACNFDCLIFSLKPINSFVGLISSSKFNACDLISSINSLSNRLLK